jgi:hypothetical protein
MLSTMEGAQTGLGAQVGVLREHAADRWQPALRFAVIVGAPLAAGVAAGGAAVGGLAAAAALLVALMGPPGYGVARRTRVIGMALLTGAFGALGIAVQLSLGLTVLLLLVAGLAFAVGRVMDRAVATVMVVPLLSLLIGTGGRATPRAALEVFIAALIGGGFVLLLDRVWPSSEHPVAALDGHTDRWHLAALIVAPAAVYALVGELTDLPANAMAFAVWGVLLIGGTGPAHRRGQLAFLAAAVIGALLIAIDARSDVLVFVVAVVAAAGAWRATRGVLPLWSVLAVGLLLIVCVGG